MLNFALQKASQKAALEQMRNVLETQSSS